VCRRRRGERINPSKQKKGENKLTAHVKLTKRIIINIPTLSYVHLYTTGFYFLEAGTDNPPRKKDIVDRAGTFFLI
jgi:hypothetical protein